MNELLGSLFEVGIVLGLVGLVLALVLAGVLTTPRHAPGCRDPKCTGCGGGPR